jgi:hypothetical protein
LYKKFINKDAEAPPKEFMDALGSNRDFNVDLVPKFLMVRAPPRPPHLPRRLDGAARRTARL